MHKKQRGATLVEVLVAIALTGVMLPTLATALVTAHAGRASSQQQLKAAALLHEATEAVRVVREAGWEEIATDGVYHPAISGSTWSLQSGAETIDGFTRDVTIASAQRDSSGALAPSGGADDPATKHITVSVAWSTPYDASVTEDLYLSRWQHNTTWVQTTEADFLAGSATNATVTNTAGGEVALDNAANGTFESNTFDAGSLVNFNRLLFTADQPIGTTLQLQIATNNDDATWNYLGPDGTRATYFTADSSIPPSLASGRYLRYKALLTGNGATTPTLSDVTINYSP